MGEQLHRLAYAAWLVDAALLADGQVHGQVQKRVAAPGLAGLHGGQCGIHIGKFGVVLRVLVHPAGGQGFYGFEWLTRAGLGKSAAKKAAHVFLGGAEHSGQA